MNIRGNEAGPSWNTWHAIAGQRNVLAHEYDEILHELIWGIATRRISKRFAMLRMIVPDEMGDD